ncbi:transposase [Paludisphaera soli]|uniref:transposase n=1 Tax=Paludisphaera soli TaxID=2712865 RepID=UPI0013EC4C9E|nr:transposase [Paludisphaera soli]
MALARAALTVAAETLPAYSSKFSRKDFTQHQLFAMLAVRKFLKLDYRGLEVLLREWAELREVLGLRKVPDHSTIQKAARRLMASRAPVLSWFGPHGSPRRVA